MTKIVKSLSVAIVIIAAVLGSESSMLAISAKKTTKNNTLQKVSKNVNALGYRVKQTGPETLTIIPNSPNNTMRGGQQNKGTTNFIDVNDDGKISPEEITRATNLAKEWSNSKVQYINSLPHVEAGAPKPPNDSSNEETEDAGKKIQ